MEYLQSPFSYVKGFNYQVCEYKEIIDNRFIIYNKECTTASIKALICKNVLSEVDIEIMKILYKMSFLNKHLIELYLNNISTIDDKIKKTDYSRNLIRLRKAGIITLYSLSKGDETIDENNFLLQFTENKSTPYCYSLNESAKIYVANMVGKKYYPDRNKQIIFDTKFVLKKLAVNQYYIRALIDYRKYIVSKEYYKKLKGIDYEVVGECVLRLKKDNKRISLFAMSVRRSVDWEMDYLNKLSLYSYFIQDNRSCYRNAGVVVLCEDMEHMKEIAQYKNTIKGASIFSNYYIIDEDTNNKNVFNNIYECECGEVDNICMIRNLKINF